MMGMMGQWGGGNAWQGQQQKQQQSLGFVAAGQQQRGVRPAAAQPVAQVAAQRAATPVNPGGMNVVGCTHPSIGKIVRGSFHLVGENHGKPTFKKKEQVDGSDVMIYFWDARDGEDFSGWWFGPSVGGDLVWAYHNDKANKSPPTKGWTVPFNGEIDLSMHVMQVAASAAVTAQRPAGAMTPAAQGAAAGQAMMTPQQRALQQKEQAKKQELSKEFQFAAAARKAIQKVQTANHANFEDLKKTIEDEVEQQLPFCGSQATKIREEAAKLFQQVQTRIDQAKEWQQVVAAKKMIEKVSKATPANFEKLKQEAEAELEEQLLKCGSQADKLREEAVKVCQQTEQRIDLAKEEAALPPVPTVCNVAAHNYSSLVGPHGQTLKRLREASGCAIEVPDFVMPFGSFAVRLAGGKKQRKLAIDAINDLIEGASPDDIAARGQGAIVFPHGLDNADRKEWLGWRLLAVGHEHHLSVDLQHNAVRLWPLDGSKALTNAAAAAAEAAAEAAVDEAHALEAHTVEAKADLEPEAADFPVTVASVMDQYGLLVRVMKPQDDIIPVQIIGPRAPARDAGALLWARFVQGKATAPVLQVPGAVQSMTQIMAADFDRDIKALEVEHKVEVSKIDTMLWIAGDDPNGVAAARETIYEMLEYYLPEEFHFVQGLAPATVEQLRRDGDLRVLTAKRSAPSSESVEDELDSAKPECVVVLELEGSLGTAWICGKYRTEVKRRIDAVVAQLAAPPPVAVAT